MKKQKGFFSLNHKKVSSLMFIPISRSFICRGFSFSEELVYCSGVIVGQKTCTKIQMKGLSYTFRRRDLCQFSNLPIPEDHNGYSSEETPVPQSRLSLVPSEETSIFQSPSLQSKFKKWQELRKGKLTASTFGGAIGFWHGRRVQLWLEKLGAQPCSLRSWLAERNAEPFTENLATAWSNMKEEEARERYKLVTGNNISLLDYIQVYGKNNPQDDWLACSSDAVIDEVVDCVVDGVTYGLTSRGVLEIKCPFYDGIKEKSYPWSRVPLYCVPQAQGLMEILDRDWIDLYCWTVNGSSLFRMYRDREFWELMKIALSDFWWNHVQPAKELYLKYPHINPLVDLREFKPAPRHVVCPLIVKESKYIVDGSELLMKEIHGKLKN